MEGFFKNQKEKDPTGTPQPEPNPNPEGTHQPENPNQKRKTGDSSDSSLKPGTLTPDKKADLAGRYKEDKVKRKRGPRKKKEPEYQIDPTLFHSFVNFPFNYLATRKGNDKWKLTKEETGQLANLTLVVFKKHIPKLGAYQEEYALGAFLAILIMARYSLPDKKKEEDKPSE